MARKTSTVPTRIWTFGALPPRTEADRKLISDQLFKAHRYYNRLIEIERARRVSYRETRARLVPRLAELEQRNEATQAKLEAARQELRKLRQRDRQRTEAPGLKDRIKELIAEARAIGKDLRTERKEVSEATKVARENIAEMASLAEHEARSPRMKVLQVALQGTPKNLIDFAEAGTRVQEESYQAIRDSRASCDVYWGTYLMVEEAAKTAAKSLTDPRFRRYDGSGRIGVQVQGGMSTSDLFGDKSSLLQIDPLPPGQLATRSGQRHAHTQVRIRVGTGSKGRAPIWVELPILMHRELPKGTIKQAWILVRRVGTSTRYELQMMIEAESFNAKARGKGTVALDVGWRSLESGNLRVAYWVDSMGGHGSLELPERVRQGFTLPDTLRGFNDIHFDAAKKAFREWMGRQDSLPEWLVDASEHVAQWRQPRRLAVIAHRLTTELAPRAAEIWKDWKAERLSAKPKRDLFAPQSEISEWLMARGITNESERVALYLHFWRLKNRHLLNWESNQRERLLAHRKDVYNKWANWLVRTYDTIVLEDFDLRSVAKRANPEEEEDLFQAVRHNRTVAAVSELRLAIKERAAADALIVRPTSRTTITCFACRHVEDFDRAAELVHTCPACERTWDQDWNHAANLILDVMTNDPNAPPSGERSSDGKTPGPSREGSKPAKRLRKTKALTEPGIPE